MTLSPTTPDPLDTAFSSKELLERIFPPVEYVIPGMLAEGLGIIVAPPKLGKSWMVLGIGVAAAEGGHVFGKIKVKQRPVLYLALEDGPRRLQDRLKTIGHEHGSPQLLLMTDLPAGLLPTINAFIERNADQKPLVILDTLGKVRNVYAGNDAYQKDYAEMSLLKNIVDTHPGSSLLVVHHTNKGAHGDFVSSVSGTQGIAGAADTILSILRDRNDGSSTLNITSRDAPEGEYAMTLEEGHWTLEGDTLTESAQALLARKTTAGVGDDMAQILDLINKYPEGMKPKDIATLLHMEDSKVRLYLRRAVDNGRVLNPKRGLYTPVTSVTTVTFPNLDTPEVTQVTEVTPSPEGTNNV